MTKWYLNEIIIECEDAQKYKGKVPERAQLKCKDLDKYNNIDEVRKNVIFLYIYYDNLGYTKITEEPMYDLITFLSSIGGK